MMSEYNCGIWAFGQILDRYATDGYGPPVSTLEAIELAASTGKLAGVDLNYPFSDPDNPLTEKIGVDDVRRALAEHSLRAVCITPVIYNRTFARGSFTNPDEALRQRAIDLSHEAVEVAEELGAGYVKFWPGQDGYDYPFQVDYAQLRKHSIDAVAGVARAHPSMRFGIEYKLKEPRTRLFWSTAAATLLAIEDMGVDNVGIVIDFGHSLFAKENPAEVLSLIHARGRLVDVELCDNYREWDDDLTVGALHLVETLEFLRTVDDLGRDEPLKLDLFPYREDAAQAARDSIDTTERLRERAAKLDTEQLAAARANHDSLAAQRAVQRALLS